MRAQRRRPRAAPSCGTRTMSAQAKARWQSKSVVSSSSVLLSKILKIETQLYAHIECHSVQRRDAESRYGVFVFRRGIAFVALPAISRIFLVVFHHHHVTRR